MSLCFCLLLLAFTHSIIHEAADAGDVEALRQLLEERAQALEQRRQQLLEVSIPAQPGYPTCTAAQTRSCHHAP